MKRVAWNDPTTGIARILTPCYGDGSQSVGESDDDFLTRVIAKDVPSGVAYHIIEDTDLPSDRYFRNAWEWEE